MFLIVRVTLISIIRGLWLAGSTSLTWEVLLWLSAKRLYSAPNLRPLLSMNHLHTQLYKQNAL